MGTILNAGTWKQMGGAEHLIETGESFVYGFDRMYIHVCGKTWDSGTAKTNLQNCHCPTCSAIRYVARAAKRP